MAEIEVSVTENVMEACARTPSIKKCVLTSSLAACVWQDNANLDLSFVVNHGSWSTESLCIEKKVSLHNNFTLLIAGFIVLHRRCKTFLHLHQIKSYHARCF